MLMRIVSLCVLFVTLCGLPVSPAAPIFAQESWRDTGIRLPENAFYRSCFDTARPGILLHNDLGFGTVAYNLADGSREVISRQNFDYCADSGLLYLRSENGAVVFSRTNPDGTNVIPTPIAFATDGSSLVYGIRDRQVLASMDGGLTWAVRVLPAPAEEVSLAVASDDGRSIYVLAVNRSGLPRGQADYRMYFSSDAGTTWEQRLAERGQGDSTFGGPYLRLQTLPRSASSVVLLTINPGYPGSSNRQRVMLSSDGGRSFSEAGTLGIGSWVQFAATAEGILRLTILGPSPNAYSFAASLDGGKTWEPRAAPPGAEGPQLTAPSLLTVPNVPAYLFLHDANGLWFSRDSARSWELLESRMDLRDTVVVTPYLPMRVVLIRFESRAVLVYDLPDAGPALRRGVPDLQQAGGAYFPETQHNLSGRFLEYWQRHGGLAQFGYPKTEPFNEINPADGRIYRVQYFERNRFEFHPENQPPYNVLLGLLGNQIAEQRRNEAPFVRTEDPRLPGVAYFPETGHTLRGRFLEYWQARGGLAIYGYPISEEFTEINEEDGRPYLVQYFERNRFEYHPENQPPYDVLLGLLGNRLLREKGWE